MSQTRLLELFLRAVHGPQTIDLLEVRFRRVTGGMGQCFFEGRRLRDAAQLITELGERTDVYFGVAPRRTPTGGRAGVLGASVVWADCDDASAASALEQSQVPPSIVVESGSADGCHAYWLLSEATGIGAVEQLNRRLALELGADGRCADGARILRPPGTQNFKYTPPGRVALAKFDPDLRHAADELDAWLPIQPAPRPEQWTKTPRRFASDPLRSITPAAYANVLLGVTVDRSRKIKCPFHEDRTPSLHLYPTAEEGWYCFGCGRGTSIYDMAAAVWKTGTRGREFLELRCRLLALFGLDRAAASANSG